MYGNQYGSPDQNKYSSSNQYNYDSEPPQYDRAISTPVGSSVNKSQREEKFREIVDKYEISMDFAGRLQQLQGFKICFIFDDSGSMNSPLMDSPLNNENTLLKATRWDELQYFAKIGLEIANLFDPDGTSIYFLNKKPSPVHNIRHESELVPLFADRPRGFTPLARVLDQVINENSQYLNEKKLLILICTDGEPTDDRGWYDTFLLIMAS